MNIKNLYQDIIWPSLGEERPVQLDISMMIEKHLKDEDKNYSLYIARTGSGKTLAASLPLAIAAHAGRKIIMATPTKELFNEFKASVEFINKHLGLNLKYGELKGKANYILPERANLMLLDGDISEHIKMRLGQWLDTTNTGDISELDIPNELKETLVSNENTSPYYKEATKKALECDILLMSHTMAMSLAFSQLQKENTIFKAFDVILFDEAHKLENEMQQLRSNDLSVFSIRSLLKKLAKNNTGKKQNAIYANIEAINEKMDILSSLCKDSDQAYITPQNSSIVTSVLRDLQKITSTAIKQCRKDNIQHLAIKEELLQKQGTLSGLLKQVNNLSLSPMITLSDEYQYPRVKVVDESAAGFFLVHMLNQFNKVIFGSATTSIALLTKQLWLPKIKGLQKDENKLYLFDHINAVSKKTLDVQVYISDKTGTPIKQKDKENPEFITYLQETIRYADVETPEGKSILILFRSKKMYQECLESLINIDLRRHILPAHKISKAEIYKTIKKKPSIILGLSTLSEGVDFKEGVLGAIVIPRLPFNPVYRPAVDKYTFIAELERMMAALKQYCGRLIRSENDQGAIYIVDNRVATNINTYGKDIVNYFNDVYSYPVEFVNFHELAIVGLKPLAHSNSN